MRDLNQLHPAVPVIGFRRLAGLMVGEYQAATRVAAIGLDTSMDLGLAARVIPGKAATRRRCGLGHPPDTRWRAAQSYVSTKMCRFFPMTFLPVS